MEEKVVIFGSRLPEESFQYKGTRIAQTKGIENVITLKQKGVGKYHSPLPPPDNTICQSYGDNQQSADFCVDIKKPSSKPIYVGLNHNTRHTNFQSKGKNQPCLNQGLKPKSDFKPTPYFGMRGNTPPRTVNANLQVKEKKQQSHSNIAIKRKADYEAKTESENPIPSTTSSCQQGTLDPKISEAMELIKRYNKSVGVRGSVLFDQIVDQEDVDKILDRPYHQLIGSGSFGKVYNYETSKGIKLAIKEIPRVDMPDNNKAVLEIDQTEISTPLGLDKPGIVKIFGIACDFNKFCIIMKNAGESLKSIIKRDTDFIVYKQNNFRDLVKEGFRIVQFLEKQKICHRDIKPENFCLTKSRGGFKFTLVDFGSCHKSRDKPKFVAHTHEYLPPKINELLLLREEYQKEIDIGNIFWEERADEWGVAMTLLWMYHGGHHPIQLVNEYCFDRNNKLMEQRNRVKKIIINLQEGWCKEELKQMPMQVYKVFTNVLTVNSNLRWRASQVCDELCDEFCDTPSSKKQKCSDPVDHQKELKTVSEQPYLSKMGLKAPKSNIPQMKIILAPEPVKLTREQPNLCQMGLKATNRLKHHHQFNGTEYSNIPNVITLCGTENNKQKNFKFTNSALNLKHANAFKFNQTTVADMDMDTVDLNGQNIMAAINYKTTPGLGNQNVMNGTLDAAAQSCDISLPNFDLLDLHPTLK